MVSLLSDSLSTRSTSDSIFVEGFQLFHAVHAVEKVLSELKRRDCNFDVLFFRDHENICVSQQAAGSTKGAKYRLTRRILIQHFIKSNVDFRIFEFDSFRSNECKNYLSGHGVHFMLCDDGRAANVDQATQLQHLIREVMESGRHVGIINSIAWRSSKVRLFPSYHDELTNPYRCLCYY